MAKRPRKPTDAELAILRVLWERGPSTVREVLEEQSPAKRSGYTTVLKLLQIMTEKGWVTRDTRSHSHVYRARVSEERTQRGLVRDLVDRAFGGSPQRLVLQALTERKASAAELEEIRKLLAELEGENR